MTLAQLIRLNRQKLGISQLELAEKLGVSQAAIGQWEREVTAPRSKNFPELAKIFGIGVEVIVAAADELERHEETRAASEARKAEREPNSSSSHARGQMAWFNSLSGNERISLGRHGEESKRFEENLFELLPMMGSSGARHVRFGEANSGAWVADYVSEKSIVEIKHPPALGLLKTKILEALWALIVLRDVTSEGQNFIAIIRLPSPGAGDDDHARLIQKMKAVVDRYSFDASLVGLKLLAVETAEEAAKAIVEIEQDNSFEDAEYIAKLLAGEPED